MAARFLASPHGNFGRTSPPTPFPDSDSLTVAGLADPVVPVYPVAQYSHRDGDAISSGVNRSGRDSLAAHLASRELAGAYAASLGVVAVYVPILTPHNIQHDARWYHLPIAQHEDRSQE